MKAKAIIDFFVLAIGTGLIAAVLYVSTFRDPKDVGYGVVAGLVGIGIGSVIAKYIVGVRKFLVWPMSALVFGLIPTNLYTAFVKQEQQNNGLINVLFLGGSIGGLLLIALTREPKSIDGRASESGAPSADGEFPTRLVAASALESEPLPPMSLSSSVSPRETLATAIARLEVAIKRELSPPNICAVKFHGVVARTRLAAELIAVQDREFYTLGVECNGSVARVIAAVRVMDLGSTATLAVEWQEYISAKRNALPWLMTSLFVGNYRDEVPKEQRESTTILSLVGWTLCVGLGGSFGFAVLGGLGAFAGAIGMMLVMFAIGSSMHKRKVSEVAQLKLVAKMVLVRAYQNILLDQGTVAQEVPESSPSTSRPTTSRPRVD